ncbi:MAG: phosphodiester glycosidase family protein [Myxococcota bacterium]
MPEQLKEIAFALMGWVLTPAGLVLALLVRVLWRRAARWRPRWRVVGRTGASLLAFLTLACLVGGSIGLWVRYRPQPSATERTLFPGATYRRFSRQTPRPIAVHVVTLDLTTPGLSLVPTSGATGACLPATTTSNFLAEQRVQLAINTQFFFVCPGQPNPEQLTPGQLQHPVGRYAVAGEIVVGNRWNGNTMFIAEDGTVSLFDRPETLHHAISGRHRLVVEGRAALLDASGLAPRLALGFDEARERMTIVLVDGRQPGFSEGVTLPELAELMVELGVYDGIEFDGGGSATLVVEDEDGEPEVLNSPIHTRIPGRERPVANHLGVRAPSP